MRVDVYDWSSALKEFTLPWSELIAQGSYNPSLLPQWLDATLQAWGLAQNARVAVIRHGQRVVAVIPCLVRTQTVLGVPCRCLELCSNVFCYHAEIVCEGDTGAALEALLGHEQLPAWDVLRCVNVVAGGATATALRALPRKYAAALSAREGERSPYVTIDRDWKSFLQTRNKKLRANISRSQRLMKEAGETGMRWFEAGSDPRELLEAMLIVEAQSWKAAAGVAIVAGTPQWHYYERLLPWLTTHGILANVLYVKDKPVAYVLCAVSRGWVGQLKTSFVTGLKDAGSRVVDSSIERAFELGCKEYDFLGDTAPHKMRWTDHVRAHEDVWLFAPHLRGRALAGVKKLSDRMHRWRSSRQRHPSTKTTEGAQTQ
jgi:CelD/BcsL family acetyltransferase involved in cellulose biosynthesis